MLFIALLDANLLGLQSLERKGRVHSAISDTMRLAGHLRDNLRAIGLKRVAKDVPNLARLLADLQKQQEASNG